MYSWFWQSRHHCRLDCSACLAVYQYSRFRRRYCMSVRRPAGILLHLPNSVYTNTTRRLQPHMYTNKTYSSEAKTKSMQKEKKVPMAPRPSSRLVVLFRRLATQYGVEVVPITLIAPVKFAACNYSWASSCQIEHAIILQQTP